MKHIYFDQNNQILWDSDDMSEEEEERFEEWRENRCYERWYSLDELEIYDDGRMAISYYDEREDDDDPCYEEID